MSSLRQDHKSKRSFKALLVGLLAAGTVLLAASPSALADFRYTDGYSWSTGARCDAAYRSLSIQAITNLPSGWGYVRASVWDYNTRTYAYKTGWLSANSWTIVAQRQTFSPMIRAAIDVTYARWTGNQWVYADEWLSDFSQDDVYSHTCTF